MAKGAKPKARPTGKKKPAAEDEKPQSERFIETARALKVDETGTAFEGAFNRILRPKYVEKSKL